MQIDKKSRVDIKQRFVKNAIPTEKDFADVFDAMLNMREDGIAKIGSDPLSIEASGNETTQKKAIAFYGSFADSDPAWVLSLNPRQDPANAATAKAGFSIGDAAGNSRLFIDRATGNVGVGTVTPVAKLQVTGGAIMPEKGNDKSSGILFPENPGGGGSDAAWIRYYPRTGEHTVLEIGVANDPQDHIALIPSGRVGIGTTDPESRLHVHWNAADVALFDSATTAAVVKLRSQGGQTVEIANRGGNLAFGVPAGTTPDRLTIEKDGDVIITKALSVTGVVRAGTMLTGTWLANNGYAFVGAANLNHSAAGNYALLQGVTAEPGRTFLNSPTGISLRINNSEIANIDSGGLKVVSGSVGVGTASPQAKLHVAGDVVVDGTADLGFEKTINSFDQVLKTGVYQNGGAEVTGDVPDTTHSWTHLFVMRHSNTANNHQLQIASGYHENDRLFFRKIARNAAGGPVWTEVATRGNNTFTGVQQITGNLMVAAGQIKLGLEGNGGGQLILANNPNDNKIFIEAFSRDGTGHAAELLLTGRHAQPVPQLSLVASTVIIGANKNGPFCRFNDDLWFSDPQNGTVQIRNHNDSNWGTMVGHFLPGSSIEYKKDVQAVSDADLVALLEDAQKTEVVRFRYHGDAPEHRLRLGVIVENCPDYLVGQGGKSLSTPEYVAMLHGALKVLAGRLSALEAQVHAPGPADAPAQPATEGA